MKLIIAQLWVRLRANFLSVHYKLRRNKEIEEIEYCFT